MASIGDAVLQIVAFGLIILVVLRLTVGRFAFRMPRQARARRIAAIGVGGAGCNAIDAIIQAKVEGVDFIACNTDLQALRRARARRKLQIGRIATAGLGAGGDPELGRVAAEEDSDRIARELRDVSLLFVAAGLGGGTGSGAAPLIARLAREAGALTVAIVTTPFRFEGERRALVAATAAVELGSAADTLITVSNEQLNTVEPESASLLDAFGAADGVLTRAVSAITRLLTVPGLVNVDFADLRTVLAGGGMAAVGIGQSTGSERAGEAVGAAIASPLLEHGIDGARSILLHITGPADLRLAEVRGAAEEVRAAADPSANVIFGATVDRRLRDEVRITVIATAFGESVPGLPRVALESIRLIDRNPRRRAPEPARGAAGSVDSAGQ